MREDDILSSLNKYFHYETLRPGQLPIIREILNERDVIVCKESGFEKSLCFQLAGVMREGLVVVVSISLSRVQRKCQELSALKIKCAYLSNIGSTKDLRIILDNKNQILEDLRCIRTSGLKFLYVTFDYFMNCIKLKVLLEHIYKKQMLQAVVVDEISISSNWIYSFKRYYSELGSLRKAYPKTPFLCFTGPLSQRKFSIVKSTLHLQHPYTLNEPCTRTNVSYQTMYVNEELPISRLVEFIKMSYYRQCGIVYCFCDEYRKALAERLTKNNVTSIIYTDKWGHSARDSMINNANKDGLVIICLSGSPVHLDVKNIDFTVHLQIPQALDIYIDETNKVGKNGSLGNCVVFYRKEDYEIHLDAKTRLYKEIIPKANKKVRKELLSELKMFRQELFEVMVHMENQSICRQVLMLKYLNDENVVETCGVCDVCRVMKNSFVVDMSFSLKKILMSIWTVNRFQKSGKSDTYIFSSITNLIDLLLGVSKKHTVELSDQWFFGSFRSWDETTLHTLIIVLLIQKFALINLVPDDNFIVYQNLIITLKGQQFLESTSEFGITFSCKDVKITKWLNFDWVKKQFLNDLSSIVLYYRKQYYFNTFDYEIYCDHLSSFVPGTWEEFKKMKFFHTDNELIELDQDLFKSCLMYHRIFRSLKNGDENNKTIYETGVTTSGVHVAVSGRL